MNLVYRLFDISMVKSRTVDLQIEADELAPLEKTLQKKVEKLKRRSTQMVGGGCRRVIRVANQLGGWRNPKAVCGHKRRQSS
ncbi:MAG: hypothetical protein OHK0037_35960 [Elainellaceae cyanobacterium]